MSAEKERSTERTPSLRRGLHTAGTLILMAAELLLITAMLNSNVSDFIYQGF